MKVGFLHIKRVEILNGVNNGGDIFMENAKCCICSKEIKDVNKTENYCCDECYKKYVINKNKNT